MEQISLGHRYKECKPRRSSSGPTKILVGKDLLKELEQRRSSPSVIAKLMGIDVLPPACVGDNRQLEFKDVFEVSEEPLEVVTKERSHHFPKGLPNLKRGALKLKKLMPSKYPAETVDSNLGYRNGLDHSNSLEINNPLFENRPLDVNHYLNHRHEKDTASILRKYPVGLANSSLRDIRNAPVGNYLDFNSIVVLEPGLGKGHDTEHSFSIPYLSHVNKNCRRDRRQKQADFAALNKDRVSQSQHPQDTEDVNVSKIKRDRYLTSNAIDLLYEGQKLSFDQFIMEDINCTGLPQRYPITDDNSTQNNKSNNSPWKICRKYKEADIGSKTLAEMFAISDSERIKRNSDSHVQIRHNKLYQRNGHKKEGCFIVLPKHAPPFPLHSSLDRGSSCEASPQGERLANTSISYNSGKIHFDSHREKSRLKQIASHRREKLVDASGVKQLTMERQRHASPSHDDFRSHSSRLADSFSTSDSTNERVLFTTDEDLVQKPAETVHCALGLQLCGEKKNSTPPFHCLDYESITLSNHTDVAKSRKVLKDFEQPSPVSILEPPTDEDSCYSGYFKYDMQDMPNVEKQINDCQLQDEPEVSMSSDDDNDSSYQSLEAFLVEEDRDFSYFLDLLISSGIIVADWQLLCKSWHSHGCLVGPYIFDRLERKYNKIPTWVKPERRLLFDLANSVLSEVLAPCIDEHPWVNSNGPCRPIWGPEGPVEKVWQMMIRQQEELAVGYPGDKVLDPKWLEVIGDEINMVGKQIARMLNGDILEEVLLEFLSASVMA